MGGEEGAEERFKIKRIAKFIEAIGDIDARTI